MNKLNSLLAAATLSTALMAPNAADAARRVGGTKDETAETQGGFRVKLGAGFGVELDPLEMGVMVHEHPTEAKESGALGFDVVGKLTKNMGLGVMAEFEGHEDEPNEAALGPVMKIEGKRNSFEAEMLFRLGGDRDASAISSYEAALTHEFRNDMTLGVAVDGEMHHDDDTTHCQEVRVGANVLSKTTAFYVGGAMCETNGSEVNGGRLSAGLQITVPVDGLFGSSDDEESDF